MDLDKIDHYSDNPDEPVLFYSGPFSNFVKSPIAKSNVYPTVEHFFQAHKATTAAEHEKIRLAGSPGQAKRRGQRVNLRSDWNEARYGVMLEGLRLKFAISRFRAALMETGNRLIAEDSPTDELWGLRSADGWEGQNLLGRALMEIRAEILAGAQTRAEWVDSSTGEPLG